MTLVKYPFSIHHSEKFKKFCEKLEKAIHEQRKELTSPVNHLPGSFTRAVFYFGLVWSSLGSAFFSSIQINHRNR
jgi:hypothetical protein